MKGLLLKDFYLMTKYCRAYLFIIAIFAVVSVFSDNNTFFILYSSLIASMVPMTLFAYDEREKWVMYCQTLPYTKAQFVSAKYVIGIIVAGVVTLFAVLLQIVKFMIVGGFLWINFFFLVVSMMAISLITLSLLMPFVFKYGSEKGRIAYYAIICLVCVLVALFVGTGNNVSLTSTAGQSLLPLCFVAVVFYGISWFLSICFYQKREL